MKIIGNSVAFDAKDPKEGMAATELWQILNNLEPEDLASFRVRAEVKPIWTGPGSRVVRLIFVRKMVGE